MWQQSFANPALSPALLLSPCSSDIDECAEGKHYCRENTMCVNTPGSFMCICHTGYIRIDDYSCTGEFLHWPFDRLEGTDFIPTSWASASRAPFTAEVRSRLEQNRLGGYLSACMRIVMRYADVKRLEMKINHHFKLLLELWRTHFVYLRWIVVD